MSDGGPEGQDVPARCDYSMWGPSSGSMETNSYSLRTAFLKES
jgi:hypothetical protein